LFTRCPTALTLTAKSRTRARATQCVNIRSALSLAACDSQPHAALDNKLERNGETSIRDLVQGKRHESTRKNLFAEFARIFSRMMYKMQVKTVCDVKEINGNKYNNFQSFVTFSDKAVITLK
jgi:hypothetical protein